MNVNMEDMESLVRYLAEFTDAFQKTCAQAAALSNHLSEDANVDAGALMMASIMNAHLGRMGMAIKPAMDVVTAMIQMANWPVPQTTSSN